MILLGTFLTDIDLGIFTANIDPGKCIYITSDELQIRHHHFKDVQLADFVKGLVKADLKPAKRPILEKEKREKFVLDADKPMTTKRLFDQINRHLDDDMVVVTDVGDCLFASADLTIHKHTEFLSPAYYTSMGFAVPASIGAIFGNPKLRPIVIVGDGAFQMTCLELSTAVRHRFNPIILVLNNKGYGTERFLQEGPFNDILNWDYHRLPDLLGGGWGFEVHTEGDFDKAFNAALANRDNFSLLNIHLSKTDISPSLRRLAENLQKHI